MAGQLALGQEGVGVHDVVLSHAPEGDAAPVLGAGEDLLPGAHGGVVGVVGQDELVEVGEPVPAEVLQPCAVGADVEPFVGALKDLVAGGLQPHPVDVADERVGDHEDVVGVGAQGCQDAGDVVADAIMRIEVEVDDSAVSSGHVGPLRQSWSEQVRTSQSWSISTTLAVPVSHAEPSAH